MSKCNWYENGEKSTKFFLNLEKYRTSKSCLPTIIVNKKELNESQQIDGALYNFYQTLFKVKLPIPEKCIQGFLDKVSLPKLNENQTPIGERAITESELLKALPSMNNDKSPGNGCITKKFQAKFWDVVKEPFCASTQQSFIVGKLSTSQKQAITKLIKKKYIDKRFMKSCRPISLLNVDIKLISKVPTNRLKSVIFTIVNQNQAGDVHNRFMTDVLEVTNSLDIEGILMRVDIDKAFNSINHSFLMCV